MTDIPQFSLPLRLDGNGDFAVNEQDSLDEITDCVQAIVRYPLGYRIEKPDFGVPEQEFQQGGADAQTIRRQIDKWEPRARETVGATLDELVANVRIDVEGGA